MSRIGKRPIKLAQDVKVALNNRTLQVKGPKGELELQTHPDVDLVIENNTLSVIHSSEDITKTALIGTTWKLINNMIHGVSPHKSDNPRITVSGNITIKDLRVEE